MLRLVTLPRHQYTILARKASSQTHQEQMYEIVVFRLDLLDLN